MTDSIEKVYQLKLYERKNDFGIIDSLKLRFNIEEREEMEKVIVDYVGRVSQSVTAKDKHIIIMVSNKDDKQNYQYYYYFNKPGNTIEHALNIFNKGLDLIEEMLR